MSTSHKLSLWSAIFINVNIMLGTGVFVNTVILAQKVGALGGFLYLMAGLIMLPLIYAIAQLTQAYPGGNFYTFGTLINPFFGFISIWIYFIGKLATATLATHVFTLFLQSIIPSLGLFSPFLIDTFLIIFFTLLNLLHVKTGSFIQNMFLLAKLTPVLGVISYGLHYAQLLHIQAPHLIWSGIPVALPLTLFCCLGFEASCSLATHIQNPEKNASRAILISFGIVITLAFLYQTLFYATTGPSLAMQTNYTQAFPLFMSIVQSNLQTHIAPLMSLAIALSALGAAYGILYANAWNLYTLAQHRLLPYSSFFIQLNRYQMAFACIITEGIICLAHLFFTKGAQIPLQYTSTLACLLSYTISVIGLFKIKKSLVSILGLLSCTIALYTCIQGFFFTSIDPFIRIISIIIMGIVIFWYTTRNIENNFTAI